MVYDTNFIEEVKMQTREDFGSSRSYINYIRRYKYGTVQI